MKNLNNQKWSKVEIKGPKVDPKVCKSTRQRNQKRTHIQRV